VTINLDRKYKLIIEATDLEVLNNHLTEVMKHQQIQAIIRNDNLSKLVDVIVNLSFGLPADKELFAAAVLGRIAAVARGRESEVTSRVHEIFSEEPVSIDSLFDGDEKDYAAKMIGYSEGSWVIDYCASQALSIDTANNARRELLRILLVKTGSLSECIRHLISTADNFKAIEQSDAKIKRSRRILESLSDVIKTYEGEVGHEPGSALARLYETLVQANENSDNDALFQSFDAAISILVRVIELRYSHALHSETYQLLQSGKKLFSLGQWARFLESSVTIRKIRMNILETALVLARQNRTDREILRIMELSWSSSRDITSAIKRHFKEAVDIAPDVSDYWLKVGRVSQSERIVEHKLGNTEDQQIGELLIQLDANRENMSKLNRAVVPVLETFDPIQAATVRRAANGYEGIAQVAERLARMRKLSKTDLLATVVQYNPIEHDMEGGHRSGVRTVRVVRDGIMKEFGGKKKTLVKPRVEVED
jgi:hypothetical protein